MFEEYMAMDRILPFGDEKICWVLANGFAAVIDRLNLLATDRRAKEPPDAKPQDFIPWMKKKTKKKRPGYVNPNAAALAFRVAVSR